MLGVGFAFFVGMGTEEWQLFSVQKVICASSINERKGTRKISWLLELVINFGLVHENWIELLPWKSEWD